MPTLSGLRDGHKSGSTQFIDRVWKEYVGGLVTRRSGEELLGWPKSSFGFPYDIKKKKSKQTFWPAYSMADLSKWAWNVRIFVPHVTAH